MEKFIYGKSAHGTGCPGKVMESPSMEVFKKHVDVTLWDMVQ